MADPNYIHFHLWDPTQSLFKSNRNDKAQYTLVSCDKTDTCAVFERGECIQLMTFSSCVHGKFIMREGYTRRARKFRQWIREQREAFSGIGSLRSPKQQRVSRVGDYIWLPYAFMDIALNGGQAVLFSKKRPFVPLDQWNADLVVTLCECQPQAVFGGTITDYQKEQVPLFLQHLKEDFPDILDEAAQKSAHIRDHLANLTNVGRKAYLRTLVPNVGVYPYGARNQEWVWDGHYLIGPPESCTFLPVKGVVRIEVGEDAVVTVTDDAQVQKTTQFAD